jgi:hypothetical protein
MKSERQCDAAMTRWLDALDVLGRAAPLDALQTHLARAPEPAHPDVAFLAGYVAALQVAAR